MVYSHKNYAIGIEPLLSHLSDIVSFSCMQYRSGCTEQVGKLSYGGTETYVHISNMT